MHSVCMHACHAAFSPAGLAARPPSPEGRGGEGRGGEGRREGREGGEGGREGGEG